MAKLEEEAGIEEVADLRLVSKDWHAAFREYPCQFTHSVQGPDTQRLLAIQPNISSLTMMCRHQNTVDLGPLAAATHLTTLSLNGTTFKNGDEYLEPLVKLSKLPSTLLTLDLDSVFASPAYCEKLPCTSLTKLLFTGQQNTCSEIVLLLQQLPGLRVNHHFPLWL